MDSALFHELFNASPNAYMVLDREFRFVAANRAYLRTTGTRLQDLLGRSLFDAFPHDPDDPDNENARLLRTSLERVLQTRAADVIAFIPYRVARERGGPVSLRYWSATHTPILDDAGEVGFILQHTVDVTDLHGRRRAGDGREELGVLQRARHVQERHDLLEAERTRLRRLVEQAPGFVAVLVGPEHVFEVVNAAYRRLIGNRDVTGQAVRTALPELAGQGFFETLDRVYASGEPFTGRGVSVRLARQPGAPLEEVFVDFLYQPIFHDRGTVSGIFVQGHDITLQKRLETEREALLQQQRLLTSAIPQHVWTADAAGALLSVNERVVEYFGVPAAEILA
jgi:PAS domain S-box-containing protein